jgi:cyclase
MTPPMDSVAPASGHFRIQQVGDGVHAAIALDGGWAVGNAGFVDLGDRTIVFDTFAHPDPAVQLRAAAERATGRPASIVVNSHPHRDHIRGNQVFPDAIIVSSSAARARMAAVAQERQASIARLGIDAFSQAAAEEFRSLREGLPESREDTVLWDGYRDAIVEGIVAYKPRLPDLGIDQSMTVHGSKGSVELLTFGRGHSPGDALMHVPEERVVFLGDLLFIGYQPYFGDGDLDQLLRVLDKVDALDPETLVPGHGPPGTRKDVGLLRDYIGEIRRTAARVKANGGGPREAAAVPVAAPFDRWRWQVFRSRNFEYLMAPDRH